MTQNSQSTDRHVDIAVIGAGIAGISLAAFLSPHARVLLVEQEGQPGYHATGRSAAIYAPSYGPPAIRALTRASRAFFQSPPQGFSPYPLVTPRSVCFIARSDQLSSADALMNELGDVSPLRRLAPAEMRELAPLLRPNYAALALCDDSTADIDVAALLQGFLMQSKGHGARLGTHQRVVGMERQGEGWRLHMAQGKPVHAAVVVNAAGAWADEVGAMAGAERIGLLPKRRSAAIVQAPPGFDVRGMAAVIDVDEQFYVKPDAGNLLISPANEDVQQPCDVQPEELDIALGLDRAMRAFDLDVKRIQAKWAGLRSFVADKTPVVGWSDKASNFFWLAGQGGYGIQSSPALAELAAAQILGREIPSHILQEGLDLNALRVQRLAVSA